LVPQSIRMNILELNHVALHVADVAASEHFYRRVLRLTPLPRPAFDFPGAWFRLGGHQELHLIGRRNEPVVSGSRSNHFALLVDDITAWEQHLNRVSAPFRPRKQRPDGAWQIFLSDPDGHYIELFAPPNDKAT
jgi:lactoylglutathione lyase